MDKTSSKEAMASVIAKAHRSAIKSYKKSSAAFSQQADALRRDSPVKTSEDVDKTVRALEKLAAACLDKAADHERKIEKSTKAASGA